MALIAATILFLQSFFTAWAAAAMPVSPTLDAFGNPLCITSTAHDGALPDGGHDRLPNCCALGCMSAFPVLHVPDSPEPIAVSPYTEDAPSAAGHERPGGHARRHDPGRPRAPPPAA